MAKRWLSKFTSYDGTSFSYVFPTRRYECEVMQGLKSPRGVVSGASYAVRLLGSAPSVKDVAVARVRAVFVGTASEQETEVDQARANLYQGAFGKLWTEDDAGAQRWCEAELATMPEAVVRFDEPTTQPLIFGFNLFSNFIAETAITSSPNVTSSPTEVVVNNPGTAVATRMRIRIRANTPGGFNNVKIMNETNGYEFETDRASSSANHEVRLDTRRPAVEFSDDDGASYEDDFPNYVLPPITQKLLSYALNPGSNTLTVTCDGTPNFQLVIEADAEDE